MAAVMIARALDARVIAVDVDDAALALAGKVGAELAVSAATSASVVDEIVELTHGGVHTSVDAFGSAVTCFNSIANLRKRGRHVQVGLMAGDDYQPRIPMELVIARELEIVGSHGMQAFEYPKMLRMISEGRLAPEALVRQTVDLEYAAASLSDPGSQRVAGVTVVDRFRPSY